MQAETMQKNALMWVSIWNLIKKKKINLKEFVRVLSHLALVLHEKSGLKFEFSLSENNSWGPRPQAKAWALPNPCGGVPLCGVLGL